MRPPPVTEVKVGCSCITHGVQQTWPFFSIRLVSNNSRMTPPWTYFSKKSQRGKWRLITTFRDETQKNQRNPSHEPFESNGWKFPSTQWSPGILGNSLENFRPFFGCQDVIPASELWSFTKKGFYKMVDVKILVFSCLNPEKVGERQIRTCNRTWKLLSFASTLNLGDHCSLPTFAFSKETMLNVIWSLKMEVFDYARRIQVNPKKGNTSSINTLFWWHFPYTFCDF